MWSDDRLIDCWNKSVSYARYRGLSAEDAEDVASEAMIKVLRALGRGQTVHAGYSIAATRSALIDFVKRGRPKATLVPLDLSKHDYGTSDSFAHLEIEQAMSRCSDLQLRVLQKAAEGYTMAEVAEITGRSADSVKKILSRTRGRMRATVEAA